MNVLPDSKSVVLVQHGSSPFGPEPVVPTFGSPNVIGHATSGRNLVWQSIPRLRYGTRCGSPTAGENASALGGA